jgi:3-hydroxybutyryl-CoA dehydrogenase
MNAIERVAVIGAGTMGHGIAQVAAEHGFSVVMYDVTEELVRAGLGRIRDDLERGVRKGKVTTEARDKTLSRIAVAWDLSSANGAHLVIEAAPEDLPMKQRLFRELSHVCGSETILASNTSSLSLTDIAAAAEHPGRVVGMHFFNPPPRMKLLEVVRAHQTLPATIQAARSAGERMGKDVIEAKDSPGFASSRLGICLAMEAIRMVEEGVARPEDIDKAMKLGYGHPMGPIETTDLVGLDVRLAIAEYLYRELGAPQFRPPLLLKQLVRAGKLGKKVGEGFYKYDADKDKEKGR